MRKLTLVRHAKSSWAEAGLSDFDRPLNDRGRRDAPPMARRLQKLDLVPAVLVSSPALRALTTARLFAQEFDIALDDIVLGKAIYEATPKALLEVVRGFTGAGHTMLFGHNPGITDFAKLLAPCDFTELPTCAVVSLELDVKGWREVKAKCGRTVQYLYPKDVKR